MAHVETVVTWQVVDALREIEHAATHDMCDRTRVVAAIQDLGMYEAAAWLASNRHLYFRMLARARALNEPAATSSSELFGTGERVLAALCR